MTSVVDTSVKHFRSDMVGAPALSGTSGTLIAVLDACLVNGFDLKTASSLVVAGGVATLAFTGTHSATVDSVVLVAGSSIAALNGEQKVTVVGAGVVRFATAAADATATGTITFKMAPAGWLKTFSGTNLAAYKSSDLAGTGMTLRVDDTGTTLARVVGYESMTDVNTGLGAFPTAVQMAGGGYWSKGSAANSVSNSWNLFADSRMLMLFTAPYSGTVPTSIHGFTHGFGDGTPSRPGGDTYMCFLSYSISTNSLNTPDGTLDFGTVAQRAFPRNYTGLGSSVLHILVPYTGNGSNVSGADPFLGAFPSVVDGGLRLSKRFFSIAVSQPSRGELPGLYSTPQTGVFDSFKVRDVVQGTGPLNGRKLFCLSPTGGNVSTAPSSSATGASFIDITGPWR